jgi:hypothetical protein
MAVPLARRALPVLRRQRTGIGLRRVGRRAGGGPRGACGRVRRARRLPGGGRAGASPRPAVGGGGRPLLWRAVAADPGGQRRHGGPRGVPRRQVAGLRAPRPRRHLQLEGAHLRPAHRALVAQPGDGARAPGHGPGGAGPVRDLQDHAPLPGVRVERRRAHHRDRAGGQAATAGRGQRHGGHDPLHRAGAAHHLAAGQHAGGRHRRHLPLALHAMGHPLPRRQAAGLPGRGARVGDGAARRHAASRHAGGLRSVRVCPGLVAGWCAAGLHQLGGLGERAPVDGAGRRRHPAPPHAARGGVRAPAVARGRRGAGAGAWRRRVAAGARAHLEPLLGHRARAGGGGRRRPRDARGPQHGRRRHQRLQRHPQPDRPPRLWPRGAHLLPAPAEWGHRPRDPIRVGAPRRKRPARTPGVPLRRRDHRLPRREVGGLPGVGQRLGRAVPDAGNGRHPHAAGPQPPRRPRHAPHHAGRALPHLAHGHGAGLRQRHPRVRV